MSPEDQLSRNNYGPPFDSSTGINNIRTHIRDPNYYYPDGTAVFLVGGVLFKIHASLIVPPDSISPSSEGDGQRYPAGVGNLPHRITDSNDINPITLTNVAASQFRNYLFALLGSPSDPWYLALLTDAKDPSKHSRSLLVRYLDISCLARQFGKPELEEWARSQLKLVLDSTRTLATSKWNKDTLLRLNSYARSTGIEDLTSSARTFIEYFISISTAKKTSGQELVSPNLDTCVQMYKDHNLPSDDPALFGCVFASILSLGHRSTTWTSSMTQRERAVLYTAQVQLTSIADEMKSVNWLQSTANSLPFMGDLCWRCQSELEKLWRISFGKCGGLKSAIPLQDVTALARLPQYRELLVSQWVIQKCAKSKIRPQSTSTTRVGLTTATREAAVIMECTKLRLPLADIDTRIQLVYEELAHRHKDFVSEV